MRTEDLFREALTGPGLLGFTAKHLITADPEVKREFLLNLKEYIPKIKSQMVEYYGEEFVAKLASFQ